jgi:hypothetical protein
MGRTKAKNNHYRANQGKHNDREQHLAALLFFEDRFPFDSDTQI